VSSPHPFFKGIFVKPKIELASVIQALTVAEHLSFRRAAESLGVCQSSVSKRVMKLENLLGVDLFDRRHAGVKVTNVGIHFFEQVKLALEYLDVAVESAGMAGRVERGSLKIGIFSSLALGFLPELLRNYSARHPEIEVNIIEGAPRENMARLRAEQLDIAFVMGEPTTRDCDVVRFWSERVFVVLPDTHALCAKKSITWEDLQDETFILSRLGREGAIHDYVIQRLTALELRPTIRRSPVARDTLKHMVALGQGISLTSEQQLPRLFRMWFFAPSQEIGCSAVQRRLAASQQQPGTTAIHQPRPHAFEDLEPDRQIHGSRLWRTKRQS
jgi:DNA-binding transcriptional LysR family regulator